MPESLTPSKLTYRALSRQVLVIAQPCRGNLWYAAIAVVPGKSHEREAEEAVQNATKLLKEDAKHFFPRFDIKKYLS